MGSRLDTASRPGLEVRVLRLRPDSVRHWGSMTPHQAICHMSDAFRMSLKELQVAPSGRSRGRLIRFVALTLPVPWPRGRIKTVPEVEQGAGGTPPTEFERDRKAFAEALVKTKQVAPARADSIAYYAVREAYINQIPPAVVFGVMLTENSRFISGAMSDVGAVGLMQIYPKVWLKALAGKFGKDLAADSTNIKYGTYILSEYIKSDSGAISQSEIGKGLLRYNGCVRGTHTPHCTNYPSKVARYVESLGGSICGDKGFYACIAKPFVAGLFGKRDEPDAATQ